MDTERTIESVRNNEVSILSGCMICKGVSQETVDCTLSDRGQIKPESHPDWCSLGVN